MHLRSVIAEGGRETNLTDNCKSIREGGFMGCNSYLPRVPPGMESENIFFMIFHAFNVTKKWLNATLMSKCRFNITVAPIARRYRIVARRSCRV